MTNNTEPLKVGEECREAFYEYAKQCGFYDENHCVYADQIRAANTAYAAWKAAWNRRTEPSPAEVGSECECLKFWDTHHEDCPTHLPDPDLFRIAELMADKWHAEFHWRGGVAELRDAKFIELRDLVPHFKNYARQALSQQSPATVEGELTEILKQIKHSIRQARIPGNDAKRELELIHNLVERALNQRLAVKEGEEICPACHGITTAERVQDQNDAFEAGRRYERTHPVSDDQQARQEALDWSGETIEAAGDATKQEEV